MTRIKPFKAYRPSEDKVHLVASRSFITYSREGLKQKLDGNPYSYIHVINPEYDDEQQSAPFSDELFAKVAEKFDEFVEDGVFLQDEKPAFYLYQQEKDTHIHTGIIACVSVEGYIDGTIKKHEDTIHRREERFMRYLSVTGLNAEPVLLAHREDAGIHQICQEVQLNRPDYNFTTVDRIQHKLWKIDNADTIAQLTEAYSAIEHLYIADGHHRCSSSFLMSQQYPERPGADYFMAMLIPENELEIIDFNRAIKFSKDRSKEEILGEIKDHFLVSEMEVPFYTPSRHGEIGMYYEGHWYRLEPFARETEPDHPVHQLDAYILSENLLGPIFDVKDLKTDKRIRFVSGLEGPQKLVDLVDSGKADIAFNLYPVSTRELIDVADADMSMPPKSTWIEPKLRSGLTVYRF